MMRSFRHVLLYVLLLTFLCFQLIGAAPMAHAAAVPAMGVISRNAPAYTNAPNAYDPARADDANYATLWRSNDIPSPSSPLWLAYDLSGVPAAQRHSVVLAWYNDTTVNYLPFPNESYYAVPQDYTLQANAAPGGTGTAPSGGWVTLVSVSGNPYTSRMHLLDLTGYAWVRMQISATHGSANNPDATLQMDVYDASAGSLDSWLFLGGSIVAGTMGHRNPIGQPWTGGDYAQLVNAAAPPNFPLQLDGGVGGTDLGWAAANIGTLLAPYSGHFVSLGWGSNDANVSHPLSGAEVSSYYANLLTVIDAVQARGMVAVVPAIPWGCTNGGVLGSNAKALNDYVSAHLPSDRPGALLGPDLWSTFNGRSDLLADCLHPTNTAPVGQLDGAEVYQRAWRDWAVATLYNPTPPQTPSGALASLSLTSASLGVQSLGVQSPGAPSALVPTAPTSPTTRRTVRGVVL